MVANTQRKVAEKRYEKPEDAVMRLDKSVVRWKGIPVWLRCEGGYKYAPHALDGTSKVPATVDANSTDLDISSPELGYVNVTNGSVQDIVYVARIPARKQKQGVDGTGLSYRRAGGQTLHKDSQGWGVCFKDLDKTIRGEYPSAKEAYDTVTKTKALSVAFSRKLAFSKVEENPKIIRVLMTKEVIGFVVPDRNHPTVSLIEPWNGLHNMASTLAIYGIVIEE